MFSITQLLLKTVVRKFYERHAGLFLFIFFLMFGIVESTHIVYFHLSLITGMINSTLFLLIVLLLWSLYVAKCSLFVSGYFDDTRNSFLLELNRLDHKKRIGWLFYILTLAFIPVISYSVIIIGLAVNQKKYWIAAIIVLFHLIALLIASLLLERKINSLKPSTIRWPALWLNWPLPFPVFYLSSLLHKNKMALFFSKAFSFFAMIGFMNIPLDHYDYRTALMGLLFGLAAHAVIVFEFRKLEDQYLVFTRQLPLSLLTRFIYLTSIYAMILLPELVLVMVNPIKIIDGLTIYFAGISFLVFCHCSLFKGQLNMDKHIQTVTILFLVGFGLVLFKLAVQAALLLFLLAYFRLNKNYYSYEATANLSVD